MNLPHFRWSGAVPASNSLGARPRSAGLSWIIVYAYCAIAFLSGALDRPLLGTPANELGGGESPLIQIVGSIIILVAGLINGWHLLFVSKTNPQNLTIIGLILGVLCVWVLLSVGWSSDPALTFRRGIAYVGTVLVGWTLARYVPQEDMLRILARLAIVFIAVSGILAVITYEYAFHQPGEIGNPDHIGRMRGSFGHKNEFARVLGLAVIVTVACGSKAFGNKWPAAAALVGGALMMALAGSAKIFVAVPIAVLGALLLILCRTPLQRISLVVFAGFPAMLLYFYGYYDRWIVQAFSAVGRDTTMSGRDVIWAAAERSIAEHGLLGQGYAAGWAAQARYEMQLLTGELDVMGHAHNGYIQTVLDIGVIGLALALAPVAYVLWSVILPTSGRTRVSDFLIISFIAFFLIVNISGSYLTNYNDIFTMMLVCIAVWISCERREARARAKRQRLRRLAEHKIAYGSGAVPNRASEARS